VKNSVPLTFRQTIDRLDVDFIPNACDRDVPFGCAIRFPKPVAVNRIEGDEEQRIV